MIIAQIATHSSPLIPSGIGLGSVIAALCSWERNRSIFWAVIAAILSWLYVAYYVFTRPSKVREFYPPVPKYPLGVPRDQELRATSDK